MKNTKINVLDELKKLVRLLQEEGQETGSRLPRYLDDQDVMQLLHICPRTLRNLRESGLLRHTLLSKRKRYYLPEDLDNMIRENRKG